MVAKNKTEMGSNCTHDYNLLILDEPTNHLDIEAKEIIEDALLNYEGSIITVSHDIYFLNKLFNTTYLLKTNL